MGFLLKLNTLRPMKKVKDFFDFFNGRTANIRKNTYNTWGNREIFAGKLLKNIKRAEEWKRMRGDAGGNSI